jgi:hypothetical protein
MPPELRILKTEVPETSASKKSKTPAVFMPMNVPPVAPAAMAVPNRTKEDVASANGEPGRESFGTPVTPLPEMVVDPVLRTPKTGVPLFSK